MPAFGSQPGLPAFTAANNKIFMDGKPIRLRGANWFGFEVARARGGRGGAAAYGIRSDGGGDVPTTKPPKKPKKPPRPPKPPPAQGTARKPGSAQRAAAVVTRKVKETVGKARGRELVPTHDME